MIKDKIIDIIEDEQHWINALLFLNDDFKNLTHDEINSIMEEHSMKKVCGYDFKS